MTITPSTLTALPYEVIALSDRFAPGAWRSVGHYPDLDQAVRARIEDVLQQLQGNDGWLVTAEHLVIGPGQDGPATVHCCMTEIGADPASNRIPDPFNLDATRSWLLAAHGLT
ncbi:MAG: hypothetical protein JWM02_1308 [Frankiales bacterium]|nr:hypothetical protein [Frankiales bacterium]